MNKEQVKVIIKILSQKHLVGRDALQRIFVSGNHVWVTDGFIAIDVAETAIDNGKSVGLNYLKNWVKNVKYAISLSGDDFKDEGYKFPDMSKINIDDCYTKTGEVKINAKYLYWCAKYFGVENVKISHSSANKYLYQILPCYESEVYINTRAMESKVYLMGVRTND